MTTEERLAALEQRVGALVEALLGCFGPDGAESYGDMATRLAALRSPGVGASDAALSAHRDEIGKLQARIRTRDDQLAARDAEIETLRAQVAEAERVRDCYVRRADDAERERDALRRHALKLDGLCERAADVALRVVAVGKSTPSLVLELDSIRDDLRTRGEVPR